MQENGTKSQNSRSRISVTGGHPLFRATSALDRGQLKSKGKNKKSIQFCADEASIETMLRPIISANQLSIYGAVADLCAESPQTLVGLDKTYFVEEQSELMVAPTDLRDIETVSGRRTETGRLGSQLPTKSAKSFG